MTQSSANPFGNVFGNESVSPEVAAFNARMSAMSAGRPRPWDIGIAQARSAGIMPEAPRSPRAFERVLAGGPRIRVLPALRPRGVYLHIHGGGFVLGSAAGQDPMLERIAERVGVSCVSVDYRLAPENPYPCAWDDCEAAALWLARNARAEFGSGDRVRLQMTLRVGLARSAKSKSSRM